MEMNQNYRIDGDRVAFESDGGFKVFPIQIIIFL